MIRPDDEITSAVRHVRVIPFFRQSSVAPTDLNYETFTEESSHHYSWFDHNQKRYKRCCYKVRLWTLTKVILVIEIVCSFVMLGYLLYLIITRIHHFPMTFFIIALASFLLSITGVVMYSVGMFKKRESYMTFHLIIHVIMCIIFVSSAIISILHVANPHLPTFMHAASSYILVGSILAVIVQCYFTFELYSTYRYLRDWNVYLLYSR